MTSERVKYGSLCCIVMMAVAVFLTSFSPRTTVSRFSTAANVPVFHSIPALLVESYTPEFNIKSDSVIIPLKRAGRLFLIEARIDDEVGNLVFDTGASGLVINNTYFRNHLKSGGAVSHGITGAVGTVEQISIGQIEFA